MLQFIDEAPAVFDDSWDKMCEWHGLKKHTILEERNVTYRHQVFFQLLSLARMADRKKLKHWGSIQNVANFARGVGKSDESAFLYFGPTDNIVEGLSCS